MHPPFQFRFLLAALLLLAGDLRADIWTTLSSTNAPTPRDGHSLVWTGTEMIIWGGNDGTNNLNDGARYNPATNTWTPLPVAGVPSPRNGPNAVWTGSEMIVWGGNFSGGYLNTGGRYNPATNTWTSISTTGAPSVRAGHSIVWTGTEVIVWGGNTGGVATELNTGGRYNPSTDTWTSIAITGAPEPRASHSAVWTGSDMIIWGGGGWNTTRYNTGFRYNPSTNGWSPISNAPLTARGWHTGIWANGKMLIWGGWENYHQASSPNNGAVYDSASNTWSSMAACPLAGRTGHAAAWTGSKMIIWGGMNGDGVAFFNDGAKYDPSLNTWQILSASNPPSPRQAGAYLIHKAVWTGSLMLIWGGHDSSQYLGAPFSLGADADNDGIADAYETGTGIYVSPFNTGTNPALADTDADGLTDGVEISQYGSNPNIKDTDGDGFEDGFEVFTGFNPTSAASTPEALSSMLAAVEFRFNAANGVSYRIESSTDLSTWSTVENSITGAGVTVVRFYSIEGQSRKFYRARRN